MKFLVSLISLFLIASCAKEPESSPTTSAPAAKVEEEYQAGNVSFMVPLSLTSDLKTLPPGFSVRFFPEHEDNTLFVQLLSLPSFASRPLQPKASATLSIGCGGPAELTQNMVADVLEFCGDLSLSGEGLNIQANTIILRDARFMVELGSPTKENYKRNKVFITSTVMIVHGENTLTVTRKPDAKEGAPNIHFIFAELQNFGHVQVKSLSRISSK